MCGIVGIIKKNSAIEYNDLFIMAESLKHRGPDEGGIYLDGNFGIGHRRLSIIDVESGQQPMKNEDGTVILVYNGEIYNYVELRKELENKGYRFYSHSDSEVLLRSYEEWGEECPSHLRGMFAFAIIDYRGKRLFLARDYLGIKPLVYYYDGSIFAFSSEIDALRRIKSFNREIDINAINCYLHLQYIPAPMSIYCNVKKLMPGCCMSIDLELKNIYEKRYYEFGFKTIERNNDLDYLNIMNKTLLESVEKHMIADVSYGAFLSGGIDSTLIVKYMSEISNKPIETFSIGFMENEFDESAYASLVSKKYKTKHHLRILDSSALKVLPELVKHYGEPFGDSSAIPMYWVSKLASEHVKMVLSGDGSDELFGGYDTYYSWDRLVKRRTGELLFSKNIKETIRQCILHSAKKIGIYKPAGNLYLNDWIKVVAFLGKQELSLLWKDDFKDSVSCDIEGWNQIYSKTGAIGINQVQYMDLNTYLPYDILTKVDIASMCHSIETRTPFVDREVIECAMNIPVDQIYSSDSRGNHQGKIIIKRLLEKDFSSDFIYRKKSGFSIPLHNWFNDDSTYAFELKKGLLSENSKIKHFFNIKEIERVVSQSVPGHIWVLVFLEEWLQQNT